MSLPNEAMRAIQRKRTENPRTILAFYATVLGILLAAEVACVTAVLWTGKGEYLLPWLLAFGGLIFVVVVGAVFVVSVKDPSKLMLGQVTGEEYVEIQRVALGDSSTGERLAAVVLGEAVEPRIVDAQMIDALPADEED